jgi:hypothetical protein
MDNHQEQFELYKNSIVKNEALVKPVNEPVENFDTTNYTYEKVDGYILTDKAGNNVNARVFKAIPKVSKSSEIVASENKKGTFSKVLNVVNKAKSIFNKKTKVKPNEGGKKKSKKRVNKKAKRRTNKRRVKKDKRRTMRRRNKK